MNFALFWKSMLVQLVSVVVLFLLLRLLLPHSFFEDWGWLSGPVAWLLCAVITSRVLKLPQWPVVLGAILAGLPSVIFVLVGLHAVGPLVGVLFFGLWCGYRVPSGPSSH